MPKHIIKDVDSLKRFIHYVSGLNLNIAWEFNSKKYVRNRSLEQNNLMWKWNTIMGNDMGLTSKDAHECIMRELLAPKIITYKGKSIEKYSTSDMNVAEMSNYLTMYSAWAHADMGVVLPHPEDQHYRA